MPLQANARLLLGSRSTGLIAAFRTISGGNVDIASSGQEILDALRNRKNLCLALVDADLPGIELGELLAIARSEKKGEPFPIVLMQEGAEPGQDAHAGPLTGLFTRAGLLSMLFRETDRVQRMKTSLSVMVFGMDEWEEWKTRLGDAACDELLRPMVERVRRLLRSYDLFGRVGECEFVLGLPGCGVMNAISLAERIRMEVFSAPFSANGASVNVSAGFGIASSEGRSPVVVLREAELEFENARASGPGSIRPGHQRH